MEEIEQEAAEVKEMKSKLAELLAESKKVAGDEKMLRKKANDQKTELANLETELKKMKTVVESATVENAKLAEESESLASALSNLQAETDAVKKKKLNFGEELNQVAQAQAEKMKQAVEKKAKMASDVEEIKKKVKEADQENERLTKELQESEKMKKEKGRQLEEKKKIQERLSTTSSTPQNPASTPAPSSRPRFLTSSIFNKAKGQQVGSKRPALKTDVENLKLQRSSSNLTPKSNKSAPAGLAPQSSASPSLQGFREARASIGEKMVTSKKSPFDLESSSDEKQAGGGQLPTSSRDSFKTPRQEKKLDVPATPLNSGRLQPMESRARSGTII